MVEASRENKDLPEVVTADAALAATVYSAAQQLRLGQHEQQQLIRDQVAIRAKRVGSAELLLAQDMHRLYNRMEWLDKHPRLTRHLGLSALNVSRRHSNSYSTSPVTDGEILQWHGEHLLVSGLIFEAQKDGGDIELTVKRQVTDEATSVSGTREVMRLGQYSSDTGPRVRCKGEGLEFDAYTTSQREAQRTAYEQKHPWASAYRDYGIEMGLLLTQPRQYGFFGAYNEENAERKAQIEQLNDELAPRMVPGTNWEFPDELFELPLTFVAQANMLLRSPQGDGTIQGMRNYFDNINPRVGSNARRR